MLAALSNKDLARLRTLPLSEAEFRDVVWPELDTSRPERNVPFEYAWWQMKQRSDGSLEGTFGRYSGQPLKFVRARFTGETTQYRSFVVCAKANHRRGRHRRELVLHLYGSAMVRTGVRALLLSMLLMTRQILHM